MPLYHCDSCHHEYEAGTTMESVYCDWCGNKGYILEAVTPLESLIKKLFKEKSHETLQIPMWMRGP